jgi:hypothetical protein
MEIEYGTPIEDKNGQALGKVDHVIIDSWSGEPRKYVVRLDDNVSAIYFSPKNVTEVTGKKARLNLAADELERT